MKTWKWVVASLALIAGSACAEGQAEKTAKAKTKGTFVTTVGTQTLYGGKITIKVEEVDGKLDTHISRNRAEGETRQSEGWGPIKPRIKKDAAWFIYSASADEAWWFDGEKYLYLLSFEDRRPEFAVGAISQLGPEHFRHVPREVQDRLPEAFKKRPKEEKKKD